MLRYLIHHVWNATDWMALVGAIGVTAEYLWLKVAR